jgi:hypothetical protein
MASHEETLGQLAAGKEKCAEIHGIVQNGMQMAGELLGLLQNALGNTAAYGEVAGPCQAVTGQLEAAAQAVEQTSLTIDGLIARFQGAG